MDIKTAEKSYRDVTFGDDSFDDLLSHLAQTKEPYHISLLTGKTDDRKMKAVQQMSHKTDKTIFEQDANDCITKNEYETRANLERIFEKFSPNKELFYMKNGIRLAGLYTAFTQSKVKYASPQERYFLKKIQETGGLYVVDVDDSSNTVDHTIKRSAQSIVDFPRAQSGIKKLIQKLKGISVHGHEVKTERPDRYGSRGTKVS